MYILTAPWWRSRCRYEFVISEKEKLGEKYYIRGVELLITLKVGKKEQHMWDWLDILNQKLLVHIIISRLRLQLKVLRRHKKICTKYNKKVESIINTTSFQMEPNLYERNLRSPYYELGLPVGPFTLLTQRLRDIDSPYSLAYISCFICFENLV